MKLRISALTIILILLTIYSFFNFANFMNDNLSIYPNSFNYENCIHMEDYEEGGDVVGLLNKQKFCKYIDELLYKYYRNVFFVFLFLTILSWKFDSLNNVKRK